MEWLYYLVHRLGVADVRVRVRVRIDIADVADALNSITRNGAVANMRPPICICDGTVFSNTDAITVYFRLLIIFYCSKS